MQKSLLFVADSGLPQNSGDLAFTVIDPEIKRLQGMLQIGKYYRSDHEAL